MNDTRLIHRRKLSGALGFYVGAIVFVIALLWLNIYINSRNTTFFFAEPSADLAAAALNKAWDAYAATGSLLTGLATTLLTGLGLLLTTAPKRHNRPRELWPAKVSG